MSYFHKASKIVSALTKHNDINMVFLLVVVIALMIMPLPTALVPGFPTIHRIKL